MNRRGPSRRGLLTASAIAPGAAERPAFTLVELVVVVTIILIILGLVGPALTEVWQGRKESEAINTLQGLLMTARARSLEADAVESGYFIYVDAQGTQHLAPIEQVYSRVADPAWQDVFAIAGDRDHVLPAPMRIVPRYVVDDPTGHASYELFSDDELVNNDYNVLPQGGDPSQRHRNFFTLIFSVDGQLLVNRSVLVKDVDADDDKIGDRTGLPVGIADETGANMFYARDGAKLTLGLGDPTSMLLVDPETPTVALNFPSVDGLLVYDNTVLTSAPAPEVARALLLKDAQPLYVSRWTGVVIRGPVGEGAQP